MSDPTDRLSSALEDRYRIEGELGQGGMATVYLAEDLKHERQVAIKVLKPELAAVIGGERFLAEIKTTANLQHPHILPLFDSGEADGFLYYVMPYIAGENLRDRIQREGQLGVDEAVRIARSVGEALDYAHRKDIIHRDIKPANILLHDGNPLVADFGIALAVSAAGGGRMTETGLSLGTPHYMSPEQASADRDLSARSDVYSLGCVLYEMLAGHPPHTGPSAQSVLVRILTEDPRPVSEVRRSVPPYVAAVVTKAIEKLPADRFESARAFVDALGDPGFAYVASTRPVTGVTGRPVPPPAGTPSPGWMKAVVGGLAVTSVVLGWMALGGGAEDPVPSSGLFTSVLGEYPGNTIGGPTVGPDGTILAPTALPRPMRFRLPGDLEWREMEGVGPHGFGKTFSPDGEWIAYFHGEEQPTRMEWTLRRIPRGGGPARTLASVGGNFPPWRPAWGEDGWIYMSHRLQNRTVLARVPEEGGPVEVLHDFGDLRVNDVSTLPGGKALSVTVSEANRASGTHVVLFDLAARDTTTLIGDGFDAQWVSSGHLLYAHSTGTLYAVPFDPDRLEVTGDPVPVLDEVSVRGTTSGRYSVSPRGLLAYARGEPIDQPGEVDRGYGLLSPDGTLERLPGVSTDHGDAALSPDGNELAFVRQDTVWIHDIDRGSTRRLTESGRNHHNPVWSPEGTEIAFESQRDGDTASDIYVRPVDGSAPARRVGGTGGDDSPLQWLDDGSILIEAGLDILRLQVDGPGVAEPVLDAAWREDAASVSPDGRWLAYISDEDGVRDIFLRPWPTLSGRIRVTEGEDSEDRIGAGRSLVWSIDSRTIYFSKGRGSPGSTTMTDGSASNFEVRDLGVSGLVLWGRHPDGRLLVEVREGDGAFAEDGPVQLVVISNFLEVLRERAEQGG